MICYRLFWNRSGGVTPENSLEPLMRFSAFYWLFTIVSGGDAPIILLEHFMRFGVFYQLFTIIYVIYNFWKEVGVCHPMKICLNPLCILVYFYPF